VTEKKRVRIPREEARALLFALPSPVGTEKIGIDDCYGRVLAEDFIANEPIPPFARAPLDGYAIRGEDTAGATELAPVTLQITEEIAAGQSPRFPVHAGQAAKILTGAPVPEGANVVVRFEETDFTETAVTFTSPVTPDLNIVPAGDDIEIGRVIAEIGMKITPPLAGLLAALGRREICVYKKPVITVVSTGNEITDSNAPLHPGKIRNSSYHLLKGYMSRRGRKSGIRALSLIMRMK